MSLRKYLAGVALAVGMVTASWAAQRTILKELPACPDIKDFTDWLAAIEKGDAARAVDIIDGKGCIEVNKGEMVEFERLLTHPFVVCVRPIGQSQCFWTSPFAISPHHENAERRAARRLGDDRGRASSSSHCIRRIRRRDQSASRRIHHRSLRYVFRMLQPIEMR
jgi:hypothetical protein